MKSRRWFALPTALGLCLVPAGPRDARGQIGAGFSSFGAGTGVGVAPGANAPGNVQVGPSFGYGIRTGQIGAGYRGAGGLYGRSFGTARPQTTVALQPLYSAITSLPGWNGPTGRVHRRYRRRSYDLPIPHYDRNGRILWPGSIATDSESTDLRREADEAFLSVFRESKSTGHASIRPVINAKNKLSAYERKILPGVKGRSVTEGDDLERFFVDLDRSLDAMNSVF